LESTAGKKNLYRVAKQMAKSRQDVIGVNCVKDATGKVLVENDQVKEEWRKYMEKLLNEENTWDNATTCELIRGDEISKALRMMKKGKAGIATGIVSEMFMADEDVAWLTSLCNMIVAQGRIWMTGRVVFSYRFSKGKEIQLNVYFTER